MSASGTGVFGENGNVTGRPKWYPPTASSDPIGEGKLMVNNTLTNGKVVFVPMNGRQVKWYTCGPTVYDSSHVGHARTYLSFDIIRRILSDYFHYDVLYQVNITDIDDKIILRARQTKLIEDLENDASMNFEKLSNLADTAISEYKEKLCSKIEKTERLIAEAQQNNNRRAEDEQVEELKKLRQKEQNFDGECTVIRQAQSNSSKSKEALLRAAQSMLAEKLDRELGHTVTDHDVFNRHARKYEREFMEDMEALGIREPDVLTRVTEYVPHIIQFIEKIISKGYAYASNGSVYLDLRAYSQDHEYRKLSVTTGDTTEAELEESEGALGDTNAQGKRGKNDFALWKGSKPGEPFWDSPWGQGRPGWHIECSVVASDILGETLDLHAGGEDLKFPHHDNELCQSEACFGSQQWVNYFLHSGHLHIRGLKMSKSLKNFITIRQALEQHSARQLRILFLMQGWDDPMQFSDTTVEDARNKEKTFKAFFHEVKNLARKDYLSEAVGWRMGAMDHDLSDALLAAQGGVHSSLLDNFNTRDAMTHLLDLISKANIYMRTPQVQPAVLLLKRIAMYVTFMLRVFGVIQGADDFGFPVESESGQVGREAAITPIMDALVAFRSYIRTAALQSGNAQDPVLRSILEACDQMRDQTMVDCGIRMEDTPEGSTWNVENREVLIAEREAKEQAAAEIARRKREGQLASKEKEVTKWQSAKTSPAEMFKTAEYSAWDESGIPTMAADGTTGITPSMQKKLKKQQAKQMQAHNELVTKSGGDIDGYVAKLEQELKSLQLSQ